jgi:DNA-binding transcriptional LysR family regulator
MSNKRFDNLPALVLFVRIVQYGSLSGAAQSAGLSRSAVSKQLTTLEEMLGVRLLQRNTRNACRSLAKLVINCIAAW